MQNGSSYPAHTITDVTIIEIEIEIVFLTENRIESKSIENRNLEIVTSLHTM